MGNHQPSYRRRQPEDSLLHRALSTGIVEFRRVCSAHERAVPQFVEKELEGYLRCGVLEYGFARVRCAGCGYERLVAFSCKGRGFCPSCCGRRMAELAVHLETRVLPEVPYRQWVMSFPPPLRYLLAYDSELTARVLGFFTNAMFAWAKYEAKKRYGVASVRQIHSGAVTVIQRFGSALNLNVHFHSLAPDGVFIEQDGKLVFHRLGEPSAAEVQQVGWVTCQKTLAWLRDQGRWLDDAPDGDDALASSEPMLAEIYGASIRGRLALGASKGHRVMTFVANPGPKLPGKLHAVSSFDVHAKTCVEADQRKALERLCYYLARPPAAQDRFESAPGGRVAVRLKKPWSDGTTHVVLTPLELVEKLVALIPTPKVHMVRYHGCFASRAKVRADIVPKPSPQPIEAGTCASSTRRHIEWAKLMKHVCAFDVLECPRCHSRMQTIAFITKPSVIAAILTSVGHAADSPGKAA